jgi:hypothetical protein
MYFSPLRVGVVDVGEGIHRDSDVGEATSRLLALLYVPFGHVPNTSFRFITFDVSKGFSSLGLVGLDGFLELLCQELLSELSCVDSEAVKFLSRDAKLAGISSEWVLKKTIRPEEGFQRFQDMGQVSLALPCSDS